MSLRVAGLVWALSVVQFGGAGAQSPSGAPASSIPPGVLEVTLATAPTTNDRDLELLRTTLQPGARLDGIGQPGTALSRVESGAIWLTALDGDVVAMLGADHSVSIVPGETQSVLAGQSIISQPDATMTWENPGPEPAVILTTRVLDAPWATDREPDPDAFAVPVQDRFVVIGPELGGTRGRYTVKDRSGKIIGARVPTERELRFWSPVGSGAGPLTRVRRGLQELMIHWSGGVCGPIVTLDVAKDLRTIRLADHSPGCDAAATGHWLVLQLRGGWFDPTRIRLEQVARAE